MSDTPAAISSDSAALIVDTDLGFFCSENGPVELTPVESGAPAVPVGDLPLIVRESCRVRVGAQIFDVAEEGFYRFCEFSNTIHNIIYFHRNLSRLVGSIGQLHIHGWRDNPLSADELIEKARHFKLSITCGFISSLAIELFTRMGLSARPVSVFTLDQWNTYNCGHALFEYFDPDAGRWLLADPDLGIMYRHEDRLLDAAEVCRLTRAGVDCELHPVTTQIGLDLCTDHIPKQIAFYAQAMSYLLDAAQTRKFVRRVFHVVQIGPHYTVETDADRKRFDRLCSAVKIGYEHLAPEAFAERYYRAPVR